MTSLKLVKRDELGGVELLFRAMSKSHGILDEHARGAVQFEELFAAKLDNCFSALWEKHPLGRPKHILHSGAYEDREGDHGLGRAFDLDGFYWPGAGRVEDKLFTTKQFPEQPVYYLSIEAHLRLHFGKVLGWSYDAAHQDHWHCADTDPTGFRRVPSLVGFVQYVLNHIFGYSLAVDGEYGPKTKYALDAVAADNKLSINRLGDWNEFLSSIRTRGLRQRFGVDVSGGGLDKAISRTTRLEQILYEVDMLVGEAREHVAKLDYDLREIDL